MKKSLSLNEKYWRIYWKKFRRKGQQAENDKTERVTGLGKRTREEIAKWNQMTALRFQTGGRDQTSTASLRGMWNSSCILVCCWTEARYASNLHTFYCLMKQYSAHDPADKPASHALNTNSVKNTFCLWQSNSNVPAVFCKRSDSYPEIEMIQMSLLYILWWKEPVPVHIPAIFCLRQKGRNRPIVFCRGACEVLDLVLKSF